ncbi:unnamed protein product [Parascedosporium putredinis]|uniref:Alpha/beta-hydrolase n=1 Tax=Parascedosporium putredinis TaxID=1442378 RepID=A0A9P1H0X9_9PEZI|nr:unnamed protein product [Parascedosporium putredinis]CAI7992239.1 unnamed protein product [Parascedosporium putredinis]
METAPAALLFAEGLHYFADSRNRSLFEIFPTFRWVFPQAPLSVPSGFPNDRMHQWFDVWNIRDFSEQEDLQSPGLKKSVDSPGGATSIHTLLNLKASSMRTGTPDGGEAAEAGRIRPSLGAVIGISCRLPFPRPTLAETRRTLGAEGDDDDETEVLRNTPVLLEHCADDRTVLVEAGRALRDKLVEYGGQVTWKEYPDGGHWLNWPAGADDVVEFLQNVFDLAR